MEQGGIQANSSHMPGECLNLLDHWVHSFSISALTRAYCSIPGAPVLGLTQLFTRGVHPNQYGLFA